MKKILSFLLVSLLLFGCQSREEKAQELIKQDMFKTLYDFASYEPIETKIDSAFTSIYTDTLALLYANGINEMFEELEDKRVEYESARSAMEIWADSYSSLGIYKFNEAKRKVDEYIEKMDDVLKEADDVYVKIKERKQKIGRSFIGWEAKHKFRCKTKGGNFDLGNYLYVFDKDVNQILYSKDMDSKDYLQLVGIIKEAIQSNKKNIDSAKTRKNTNKDTSAISTADSLANALKGEY